MKAKGFSIEYAGLAINSQYPKIVVFIYKQLPHEIGRDAERIVIIMTKGFEANAIKALKAFVRTNPNKTIMVLNRSIDLVRYQSRFCSVM